MSIGRRSDVNRSIQQNLLHQPSLSLLASALLFLLRGPVWAPGSLSLLVSASFFLG
jgi:hypothetical protein